MLAWACLLHGVWLGPLDGRLAFKEHPPAATPAAPPELLKMIPAGRQEAFQRRPTQGQPWNAKSAPSIAAPVCAAIAVQARLAHANDTSYPMHPLRIISDLQQLMDR